MQGLEQSKPLRKMGMHSSPTGELFLSDVRVGRDRLLGETEDVPAGGREGAKDTFSMERSGVAAMSLGIIEQCLETCVEYAKNRVQFGQPIGEFQLIQEKLARMEVARLNVQNLVFRFIEMGAAGRSLTLAEASAMKLYSARAATEVAMEAVQPTAATVHVRVPCRATRTRRQGSVDLRGTDEIQITTSQGSAAAERQRCRGGDIRSISAACRRSSSNSRLHWPAWSSVVAPAMTETMGSPASQDIAARAGVVMVASERAEFRPRRTGAVDSPLTPRWHAETRSAARALPVSTPDASGSTAGWRGRGARTHRAVGFAATSQHAQPFCTDTNGVERVFGARRRCVEPGSVS
jgi:hypothetical protein